MRNGVGPAQQLSECFFGRSLVVLVAVAALVLAPLTAMAVIVVRAAWATAMAPVPSPVPSSASPTCIRPSAARPRSAGASWHAARLQRTLTVPSLKTLDRLANMHVALLRVQPGETRVTAIHPRKLIQRRVPRQALSVNRFVQQVFEPIARVLPAPALATSCGTRVINVSKAATHPTASLPRPVACASDLVLPLSPRLVHRLLAVGVERCLAIAKRG